MEELINRKEAINLVDEYIFTAAQIKNKDMFDALLDMKDDFKEMESEDHIINNSVHLCDSCAYKYPDCSCEDAVSRDDVLTEIGRWIGYLDEDMIARIKLGMKKLPSVQPKQTHSKWIRVSGYATPGGDPVWRCAHCGKGLHTYGVEASSYARDVADHQWVACPNCGFKMEEEK